MNKNSILIIGGTGFIGFHLVKSCIKKKWDITCVSTKVPTIKRRVKKVKYILADISNKNQLKKKLKSNYKYIVNLGGYVDHKNKIKVYKSHYIGCKNLFEVFKNKELNTFVQIGSSSEYGKNISPMEESFLCEPKSIYGKSKLLATNFLLEKNKKKNFPVVILRLFQAYGPHQDKNRLIPIVIDGCIKDTKFGCSPGKQFRDFIYIDDVIRAILNSLNNKNALGNIINVGAQKPKKIKSVIKKIRSIIKSGSPQFGKIKMRRDEILNIYPNISKAKKLLKWKPKISFNIGLRKTISYYLKYAQK